MHSGRSTYRLDFTIMDIPICVICCKIRLNLKMGDRLECIAFTKTKPRLKMNVHYVHKRTKSPLTVPTERVEKKNSNKKEKGIFLPIYDMQITKKKKKKKRYFKDSFILLVYISFRCFIMLYLVRRFYLKY